MARRVKADGVRVRRASVLTADLEDIRNRLASKGRRRSAPLVTVLDATGEVGRLADLLDTAPDKYPRRNGLWIRAHVRDLTPRALQRFDVVFMFDMTRDELESARTAIPFADGHLKTLRRRNDLGTRSGEEFVLVFLALDSETIDNVPQLVRNPVIINLRDQYKEVQMSVDEYVPVIVEAVKFFFSRWGARLDRAQEQTPSVDIPVLAISPDYLETFTQSPGDFLVKTVNDETAALLDEKLRSLMRLIHSRQGLIDRRREKAILASEDEQAKLELKIEADEELQAQDWRQLIELLNRVLVPASA